MAKQIEIDFLSAQFPAPRSQDLLIEDDSCHLNSEVDNLAKSDTITAHKNQVITSVRQSYSSLKDQIIRLYEK